MRSGTIFRAWQIGCSCSALFSFKHVLPPYRLALIAAATAISAGIYRPSYGNIPGFLDCFSRPARLSLHHGILLPPVQARLVRPGPRLLWHFTDLSLARHSSSADRPSLMNSRPHSMPPSPSLSPRSTPSPYPNSSTDIRQAPSPRRMLFTRMARRLSLHRRLPTASPMS